MENEQQIGPFAAFVLLSSATWDVEKCRTNLAEDWGIAFSDDACDRSRGNLVFDVDGMTVVIGLMTTPVPGGEAEHNAATNYLWPDAVETTKKHRAHLLVAVLGGGHKALAIGTLWVKIVAACCKQDNALGVYACGTVFEPKYYLAASQAIRQGELPIYNWVYFGLYTTDAGTSAYTYGLKPFGKDEMEVLNTQARPSDLRDYLFDLAYYVLSEDVRLNEGETIGFSEEQKLPIIRSESAVMDGMTLKIGYPEDYSSH